jgi:hypothetical protein
LRHRDFADKAFTHSDHLSSLAADYGAQKEYDYTFWTNVT